jgi:ribosomal protein S27AE
MAEVDLAEAGADQLLRELRRLHVREVSEAAADALPEPHRVRSEGEHLGAMVGLDERGIARREQGHEVRRRSAHVGGDAERVIPRGDADGHLGRIVRDVLGGHLEAADAEAATHRVFPDLEAGADPWREDARVEVDGTAEGAGDLLDAAEVIAVVMRREDGVDPELVRAAIEHDAECGQARLEGARSEAGIDQDANAVGLDQEGIAAGAGAEDERAKRHVDLPNLRSCEASQDQSQEGRADASLGIQDVSSYRADGIFVSTRPCPNCGSPLAENARFCGQCGTTIGRSPAAAPSEPPNVHEEVTVAREKPDLSAFKTLMDSAPFGSPGSAFNPPAPAPAAGSPPGIPTPMVPPPVTQSRPQPLSQTVSDPEALGRDRDMVKQALGVAATAQAAPVAPPKHLQRTMMMGAESATAPHVGGGPAPSRSDRPTAPPVEPNAAGAPPAVARGGDASPLSRSVLSPGALKPPSAAPPANAPAAAGPAAPAPAAAAAAGGGGRAGAPALRTMLGMPATDLELSPNQAPAASPPVQNAPNLGGTVPLGGPNGAAPAAPAAALAPHNAQKTMLGVAIPGIAPTHGAGSPTSGPTPLSLQSRQSTMLGVAIPGIAPTHGSAPGRLGATMQMPESPQQQQAQQKGQQAQHQPRMPSQVQNTALGVMVPPEVKIVPRPKTLIDAELALPLPAAPQIPEKKGIPAIAVVGILFAIVAIAGGGVAFFALRNSGTLSAVPQLDETGKESLKIGCTTCPDGTTVSLGASTASVTGGNAVLPLPAPLSIGDNDLIVKIERPAGGRHEDVKVHVPVAYRVRADLSTLSAKPPAITVRVEATPGSLVSVEDKPVALDATGRGAYAIDLTKETEGTGETKSFERKIPFAITPKGGKQETGQLTARTAIVPLALDAPGRWLITDKGTAAVAGQTRPGSTVTIDGQNVAVDAQGKFGVRVELSAVGDKALEIVAASPPNAPRIVKVKVTRVASLTDAAKGEDAQNPVGYDAFGAEPEKNIGTNVMVEGDVVDARATAGHTVLLIEDKKHCGKSGPGASCLVRVVHGDEDKAARGDIVRAYGRVLGSVTASGKTVPDIEASLVLPIKAAK